MFSLTGKYYRIFLVVFTLLIITVRNGISQFFITGTDPATTRWRQINTPNFKVIYPVSFEQTARFVANGLEYIYEPGSKSLMHHPFRFPVIIHNQTTIPSSATLIAPKRMDYFTNPPQDIYPQDWIDQLIIHEFRHTVQYSALNRGFTKGLSYFLGEQGIFGVFGLYLPVWFIEGDATVIETALHQTGRGRIPSFEMKLRAQFLEKGIYSYEKANYGSFLDFVPGKYELGYQLVGLTRDIYGPDIWGKVVENVGKRPYTLTPFSSSIKRLTGFNKYNLYDTLAHQIQRRWQVNDKLVQENNHQVLSGTSSKFYTNYNLPVIFRDSMIIAVKSSLDDLTCFVLLDKEGEETKLVTTGVNFFPESLSASDSIIYWSEMTNDPRWTLRDYRVIKSFNFRTGKNEQITHCSRYYAPSVTTDGKYLAAVEVSPENKYFLVVLNALDGSLIRRISTPENLMFIHPKWSDDRKKIVSVVTGREGNTIAITDPETGDSETLLPFSYFEMKRPFFFRNFILFNASYNGIDNIYALNMQTREVSKVTSARFGASDASVTRDQSAIIYSNYTAGGYEIVKAELDTMTWIKITVPKISAFPLAEKVTAQESFIFNPDSVPSMSYVSKPYSKFINQFNFHSWMPLGLDIQNISASPGITMMSQNLLGTTVTTLGYIYNRNERNGKYYFSMTNESLYPAIDLDLEYGERKDLLINSEKNRVIAKWIELNLSAGLNLPLKWTHHAWSRSFQPAAWINFKHLETGESTLAEFENNQFTTMNYSLMLSNRIKTSKRDFIPRWSQQLQINYSNTPFNDNSNTLFAGQLTLDFPGVAKHHGLRVYGGFQKKNESFYPFPDYIIFPRGYTEIFRDEIFSFSIMYSMPLFYPEWHIGHLFYFKRFKGSFFYDYAKSSGRRQPGIFSSVGLDLTSDFSLLNLITPLDAGIRSAYNPEKKELKFEFLFALNFAAMY